MDSLELKYGCNPNQKPARIFVENGELPLQVLNGKPGYINLLDALNGWQMVSQMEKATGLPSAASFKHVSPAGAAVGLPLNEEERSMYFVTSGTELSPLACAYTRARGADRMSSFGDFVSLSDVCDLSTAKCINKEVSDGVIAPGYTEEALALLKTKRNGTYTILSIDPNFIPGPIEKRSVFGITFEQGRNAIVLDQSVLQPIVTTNTVLPNSAKIDLVIALIALKYTQSNSVCYVKNGQTIGVGAGQQSRIHCTRLAGSKADLWHLRQSNQALSLPFLPSLSRNAKDNAIEQYLAEDPETSLYENEAWKQYFTACPKPFLLEDKKDCLKKVRGVSLASDAFFPFRDNIDRARRSGVDYIVQPGGSVRDDVVVEACNTYGIVMISNGIRLFHH
ncbi:AICAR transformylase/IMP cyclohydrolase PurH [Sphaerochaeta pleomorpha str. Grapes]|uniref:AICAR transformylase/IMP cyclohydrolase PurH n=1 Tax=Sphaerochaeta pleomorpha (strain ATCC BAA-1885 / DSM 22778 / Grapes) TaxID=158190 RepID=G8QVA7_SPHPG|nr:phosphoribosylaminoimidazolecarboxamide formyltransferase [Sphaerochaeta pleomorpha]AEV30422.1 AICAR transformylase/IMP cyclohydrolase PurH [Sphaerochaeta pleomorpha str. Grapes]